MSVCVCVYNQIKIKQTKTKKKTLFCFLVNQSHVEIMDDAINHLKNKAKKNIEMASNLNQNKNSK